MRHRYKKSIVLSTGIQKKENVIRNMVTSLIASWQVVTTPKRAVVLEANINKFFSRLIHISKISATKEDATRESIRFVKSVVYTEKEGKKVISDLLPKYLSKDNSWGYVQTFKLGTRPGDGVEKIMLRLV